jgi:hypothetical protein
MICMNYKHEASLPDYVGREVAHSQGSMLTATKITEDITSCVQDNTDNIIHSKYHANRFV